MIEFSVDLERALRGLNATADEIERAVEQGLDRTAQIVLQAKARQVQRTYSRPIPRNKNGTPKWKRSGAFMEGQTIQSAAGQRTVTVEGKAADYEGRLSRLPVSQDGVNRRNAAATDAAAVVQPQIAPVFEQEIRNAIRDNR